METKKNTISFFFSCRGEDSSAYIKYLLTQVNKLSERMCVISLNTSRQTDDASETIKRTGLVDNLESIVKIILTQSKDYDRVIVFNDAFYGPLYDLKKVAVALEDESFDIWNLDFFGHLTVFDIKILLNRELLFLEKLIDLLGSFKIDMSKEEDLIDLIQSKHYSYFSLLYGNCRDIRRYTDLHFPYNLLKKRNIILPRESIDLADEGTLRNEGGEQNSLALKYIKEKTDYDPNLILSDLIKSYDLSVLRRKLNLNYILNANVVNCRDLSASKVAIIIHSFYEDQVDLLRNYVKRISEDIDVFITCSDENKILHLTNVIGNQRKIKIVKVESRGRDLSALLVGCKKIVRDYDYICFTHDKRTSGKIGTATVGQSFMYMIMENLIASDAYVRNVIHLFDNNKLLGLLAPPSPMHAWYFSSIGNEWTMNFEMAMHLKENLHLNCHMSLEEPPFVLGSAFWFRREALAPLFEKNFTYTDFPEEPLASDGTFSHALERLFPYVVQSKGFFCGCVMTEKYAAIEINNLNYMLVKLVSTFQRQTFPYQERTFQALLERVEEGAVPDKSVTGKKSVLSGLFIDFGEGFSEKDCLRRMVQLGLNGEYSVKYSVDNNVPVKRMRFDPVENQRCVFTVKQVLVDNLPVLFTGCNGVKINRETFAFIKNKDPQYYLDIECDFLHTFEVKGKILLL